MLRTETGAKIRADIADHRRLSRRRTPLTPGISGVFRVTTVCRERDASGWRKEWDSNPRNLSVQRFSRPPRSTTPPPFRQNTHNALSAGGPEARIGFAAASRAFLRRAHSIDCRKQRTDHFLPGDNMITQTANRSYLRRLDSASVLAVGAMCLWISGCAEIELGSEL